MNLYIQPLVCTLSFFMLALTTSPAFAKHHEIHFTVHYKTVNFAGKSTNAIAVNNQIPAPTLHFKEGDSVTIHVRNELDKETAIHWHGIILPWQMDGVLGITQKGIPAGGDFQYQFTLHQSGTYWYHAHAGLQEQQGLYGALIIDPTKPSPYHYTKDFAVVLSDWSNTPPEKILANLKKEGDYYSPNFPLQPSLVKFIHDYRLASSEEKSSLLDDYLMMQQMRMSLYDFSDVAYDAFLLNGQPKSSPWIRRVNIGDVVRLRFIGAGGSTIFHIKIPKTLMHVVHVQGNDVNPHIVNEFTLAPGETVDVLITIKQPQPYLIYAESSDTVGSVYGALLPSKNQLIDFKTITPFPEPLPVTREMMSNMMGHSTSHSAHTMPHSMNMPTEPSVSGDQLASPDSNNLISHPTKYQSLIAHTKTNDPKKRIDRVIHMELFGYMDRYIWFINGLPEDKAHPIILQPGKRYRFVFTNTSMMHHPMHIHGHWFILRKGNGAYDPLLHTIDVPPGATITADVDTDASGQWLFHCHLLYHMMSGMSRTLQYSTLLEISQQKVKPEDVIKHSPYHNRPIVRVDELRPIDSALIKHPMAHPHTLWFATWLDIGVNPLTQQQQLTYKGRAGSDYNKLELFANETEVKRGTVENADLDIFYWHLLDQFWAIKGGLNYFYRPSPTPYWQPGIGFEGLLPYFIDTDFRSYFRKGSAKCDIELSRETQITSNFLIRASLRSIFATKTVSGSGIGSGLNQMQYTVRPYYRLMPGLDIFAELEHAKYYGAFRTIQLSTGNGSGETSLLMGLSLLF